MYPDVFVFAGPYDYTYWQPHRSRGIIYYVRIFTRSCDFAKVIYNKNVIDSVIFCLNFFFRCISWLPFAFGASDARVQRYKTTDERRWYCVKVFFYHAGPTDTNVYSQQVLLSGVQLIRDVITIGCFCGRKKYFVAEHEHVFFF